MSAPFDPERYEATVREWAVESDVPRWLALGEALAARPGWYYETQEIDQSIFWAFGLAGAARLVVTVRDDGLLLYDHAADAEHHLGSLAGVLGWLNLHEADFEGFTPLQNELLDVVLPNQVAEWQAERDDPPNEKVGD
jgi:hypothetical protein